MRAHSELDKRFLEYRKSGKDEDLERVVEAGRSLIHHFARLYTGGFGEDAVQAGMEGLMKAVQRYEVGKGTAFATYAAHCVMGEIRHYVRKESSYYRPGSIKDLQFRVARLVDEVLKETGEPPGVSEIAKRLNVKEEGVVQAMRAGLVSLDDVEVDKIRAEKYETFKLPIEDRLVLEQAIKKLNDLQRRVVYLLFYKDLTQTQTAEKLGISQRKVSRVLHKSLQEMGKVFKI
ncbi:sigma-70 family RNA polymerase sigma factor [Dethiobacter alkaliphilus]|uniref:RNA polymerase, sigma 28 subunit, FliA/WhiG subfamily n=1 Tax=Dethiobacter alkaliphilus AHT 1 TaxID=555088 RepID=C0GE61_DETAL|nr:sigma-70 family RNA polymerase sigma factor [Dethiobacter alkaliphilus]EEG78355.1 RNA polymerase, sigma 28 subunit, FliA/WhiG subfamily [Dethiobacter alkaliphilus AHT 1]